MLDPEARNPFLPDYDPMAEVEALEMEYKAKLAALGEKVRTKQEELLDAARLDAARRVVDFCLDWIRSYARKDPDAAQGIEWDIVNNGGKDDDALMRIVKAKP